MKLPLTLPYPEASTVCDASGSAIAECRDNETAIVLAHMIRRSSDMYTLLTLISVGAELHQDKDPMLAKIAKWAKGMVDEIETERKLYQALSSEVK